MDIPGVATILPPSASPWPFELRGGLGRFGRRWARPVSQAHRRGEGGTRLRPRQTPHRDADQASDALAGGRRLVEAARALGCCCSPSRKKRSRPMARRTESATGSRAAALPSAVDLFAMLHRDDWALPQRSRLLSRTSPTTARPPPPSSVLLQQRQRDGAALLRDQLNAARRSAFASSTIECSRCRLERTLSGNTRGELLACRPHPEK